MSGKRIIDELSEEDLIALATGASPQETINDKLTEAAKFIYSCGVKHGKTKITAQLVYFTYKEHKGWRGKWQAKPMFFRDFKKFFEAHRDKNGLYFMLNEKPFDTSEETYWLMRAQKREERVRRQAQKQKK